MTAAIDRTSLARNEHFTFRANHGVGRHGWLRLTPAFGVRLVRARLRALPAGSVVTDPFSGTGTTPLAAAELGHLGQSTDVNPFLVWLGRAKVRHYPHDTLEQASAAARDVAAGAARSDRDKALWQPDIHRIERWWGPGELQALRALRAEIDAFSGPVADLLQIALCRVLISVSNAAFNHQSMSLRARAPAAEAAISRAAIARAAIARWEAEATDLIESARLDLPGTAAVHEGDSRGCPARLRPADLVLTSPPYVNRMSYIRELRPYMYWLRFLDRPVEAGQLDWRAIGGTWGSATSRLRTWLPSTCTPVDDELDAVCARIAAADDRSGPLLAAYVRKYHHDMWLHFQASTGLVRPGGRISYIVGNSTFYGHVVPAQDWYARMLRELGYVGVEVEVIRKRNSNKALFEFDVRAFRP
ncbi:Methyltransferase domain-containing protein [Parafrankia irregularis]|uniref:site-specific DNA-methyltransferase (cytosine-N(4)-specific) n=1 Tax=Parafrankia irregularis TaxID=795642 RepID=A0A0S4QTF7_9ACTN|nr:MULTISPECIES: DNA methyltransferase [Parafrankia]MBE3205253.1 DNA methyltransferase [Parafrankia sp. CH37]CUU58787.1 Methyltransferase domain-containing protein [Parafrankia irregularis]